MCAFCHYVDSAHNNQTKTEVGWLLMFLLVAYYKQNDSSQLF